MSTKRTATDDGFIHLELQSLTGEEMSAKFHTDKYVRKLTPTYKTDGTAAAMIEDLRYQNTVLTGGIKDTRHPLTYFNGKSGFSYIAMGTVPREQLKEVQEWIKSEAAEVYGHNANIFPDWTGKGRSMWETKITWNPVKE